MASSLCFGFLFGFLSSTSTSDDSESSEFELDVLELDSESESSSVALESCLVFRLRLEDHRFRANFEVSKFSALLITTCKDVMSPCRQ